MDYQDKKFNRLYCLEGYFEKNKRNNWKGLWLCDCGSLKVIQGCRVKAGEYKSCGCYRSELTAKRNIIESEDRNFSHGENHHKWKADNVGYNALHSWIKNNYGKAKECENKECEYKNPKRYDWANISGKYKRTRDDFVQLCVSCHKKYDLGKIDLFR